MTNCTKSFVTVELKSWMLDRQRELFKLWHRNLQDEFEWGFQLTSSPVFNDPTAIVIGRNPGIGAAKKKQGPPRPRVERMSDGKFGFPADPDCIPDGESYPAANALRNFIFDGHEATLINSIETNAHFLASDDFSGLKTGWQQAVENGKEEILEQYDELRLQILRGMIKRGEPDILLMFTGNESEIVTTREFGAGKDEYYPLDRLQAEFGIDVEIDSRYRISRDNRTKRGITTTEYRITVGDIGGSTFVGLTPHLSNPNIPTPVRELIREEIGRSVGL